MDHVFHKLLNKMWWIRDGPEITLLILKQIMEDIKEYIKVQTMIDTSHMNFKIKLNRIRRCQSSPIL
jgi:hypothetical protein